MKWIALVALLVASAFAQDAAPLPAPLPAFHSPAADDQSGADDGSGDAAAPDALPSADSEPATDVASPDETTSEAPATATEAIDTVTDPQPVTLTALSTSGGKPLGEGVVWRVYSAKPSPGGDLPLAAKSTDPVAHITLPPGEYIVHAAYGRAQVSDAFKVKEGDNKESVVLEVGGLRLAAAITGDVPIPINLLRFDVFTAGQNDSDRALIAQGLGANDILTVNAGTYHVVSYFGDVNAIVRADLRVEAGQLTDATLYHKAAQVSLKLVSEQGGEAIADVDWTIKSKDGTTLFTDTGTFPVTVLSEGDYTVFAKRGDKVYNRDFAVEPGQPCEIDVLTAVY